MNGLALVVEAVGLISVFGSGEAVLLEIVVMVVSLGFGFGD